MRFMFCRKMAKKVTIHYVPNSKNLEKERVD